MRIAVFGLGKIGLPLAVQFARKGHTVVGVDVDEGRVEAINSGEEPFPGEQLLGEYLRRVVELDSLRATMQAGEAMSRADAVVIAVPLYVDDEGAPDFGALDAVSEAVGRFVREGTLISVETTVPVGTTRDRIGTTIERVSGLHVGSEIHLVFSPERVLTGRFFADLRRYPKLVGGVSEASEIVGAAFYESVLDFDERPDLPFPNGVRLMGSSEAAEMAKLAETTYRDVNIALANQFALFADSKGLDVYEVIDACNSQPYSHIHQPGVAVGGHCIPVYPRLYLWSDTNAAIVRCARETNAEMPRIAARRVSEAVGPLNGRTVLILGAAYRGGVKETAYSGVFPLRDALKERGADVVVHDPMFSAEELTKLDLEPFVPSMDLAAAIVQADHAEYCPWIYEWRPKTSFILDGRRALLPADWPGVRVSTLGSPSSSS